MKRKIASKKKEVKNKEIKIEYKPSHQLKEFVPQSMQINLTPQIPLLLPADLIPSSLPELPKEISNSLSSPLFPLDEWEYKSEEEINNDVYNNSNNENDGSSNDNESNHTMRINLNKTVSESNLFERNLYKDPDHNDLCNSLPIYLINLTENDISWCRPNEYTINYYLDRAIKKKYIKKNYIQLREEIKVGFKERKRKICRIQEEHKNIMLENNEENDNFQIAPLTDEQIEDELVKTYKGDEVGKYYLQKDFYNYIKKYDFQIVHCDSREETDDEYQKRKEMEEIEKKGKKTFRKIEKKKIVDNNNNKQKDKKDINKKDNNNNNNDNNNNDNNNNNNFEENIEKISYKVIKPSNITLMEFKDNILMHNSFYSWISSIFQMIIDLDITDCSTCKSIFCNIYPQKDGIPIYNPSGKYIIKLYQMGKARKITIDDRMLCNKDHEYIFPQCPFIEELWPALFIKALLKLNMYKTKHPKYYSFEEFNDVSIIYALTGMHIATIDTNPNIINLFLKDFKIREKEKTLSEEELQALREKNDISNLSNANGDKKDKSNLKDKDKNDKKKSLKLKKGKKDNINNNNDKVNNEEEINNYVNNEFLSFNDFKPSTYYALYKTKETKNMKVNKEESYYEIINRFDEKLLRNGSFINQYNLMKNQISNNKEDQGIYHMNHTKKKTKSNSNNKNKNEEDNLKLKRKNNSTKNIKTSDSYKNEMNEKLNNLNDNIVNDFDNNNNNSIDNDKTIGFSINPQNNAVNKCNTLFQLPKVKFKRKERRSPTIIQKKNQINNPMKKLEELICENNIICNYLYSVSDFFDNDTFNMKRLKFLDFSDLEKVLSDKKVQFKQLALKEKRKYLISRRELKKKQLDEKNERLRDLSNLGTNYQIFKITTRAFHMPKISFFTEYTETEINFAKKCILNNWKFPPVDYFKEDFRKKEEEKKMLLEIQKRNKELEELVDNKNKSPKELYLEKKGLLIKDESEENQENKKKKKFKLFEWTPELYNKFIGDVDIYKTNNLEPWVSEYPGAWMSLDSLLSNFNKMLIIQNHRMIYHYKLLNENTWNYYKADIFEPLEEFNCFILSKKTVCENDAISNINNISNNNELNSNIDISEKEKEKESTGCILVIFEPLTEQINSSAQGKIITYPYICFDILDITNPSDIKTVEANIILNNFYSIYSYSNLDVKNEYLIKLNGGNFQNGYVFQLMSQYHQINNLSYITFLKDLCKYNYFSFNLPHTIIEKDKSFILARFFILPTNESFNEITNEKILIQISLKYNIKFIKKYVKIFLLKNDSIIKKEIECDELFYLLKSDFINNGEEEKSEKYININEEMATNLNGKKNKNNNNNQAININNFVNDSTYCIVISIKSEYTLLENEFQLEILTNENSIKFEKVDEIEPYEISDKFHYNKDSILFSYYIYPSDKISCSLNINLYEIKNKIQCDQSAKSKNKNKKETEDALNTYIISENLPENYHLILELYQLTKEPCLDYINESLKYSYSNKGILLKRWNFYNEICISHLFLKGELLVQNDKKNKGPKKDKAEEDEGPKSFPYLLMCYFDTSEVSNQILRTFDMNGNIGFTIRVFASDNIAFIKDTSKHDHEQCMKDEWENKDNGRGLRANKSRTRFLIMKKKENHPLTEGEIQILKEERQRRTINQIDHIEEQDENKKENTNINNNKNLLRRKSIKQINKSIPKSYNKKDKNKKDNNNNNNSEANDDLGRQGLLYYLKHQKPLSMKNIFEKPMPKMNHSKSLFVMNYLNYINNDRKIYQNKHSENQTIFADKEYVDLMKSNIISKFEESEKIYKLNKNEKNNDNNNENNNKNNNSEKLVKNEYTEMLKNMSQKFNRFRISKKKSAQSLYDIRKAFQDEFDRKDKLLKTLSETMESNIPDNKIDFNQYIQLYKDGKNTFGEDNVIVSKFFKYCSKKKEDIIKGEMKKLEKNKNEVVKILEDINYHKWEISAKIIDKLKDIIK